MSSKLSEAYFKEKYPESKEIENPIFDYSDLGNLYSYVKFHAIVDGVWQEDQLDMKDFFEWMGSKLLKITENE